MAYSIDDLRKLYLEGNKSAIAGEKAVINRHYDTQEQTFNDNYAADVAATEQNYDNLFDQNAVQRMINERQVAESMAKAGLTKSGMNASQMLASQLSYGNANAATSRQRQAELDILARTLRSNLQTVEEKRASDLAGVDSTYSANADKYATDVYNEQVKSENELAQKKSTARTNLISTLADDELSSIVKNAYLSDYINKYGYDTTDTALLGLINQQGLKVNVQKTENGYSATVEPYTTEDFDYLYNAWVQHGVTEQQLDDIIAKKGEELGFTPSQAVELKNKIVEKAHGVRGSVDPLGLVYKLSDEYTLNDDEKLVYDYSGEIADSVKVKDQYGVMRTIGDIYYNYREYLARTKYGSDWKSHVDDSDIKKAARKKIIQLQNDLGIVED